MRNRPDQNTDKDSAESEGGHQHIAPVHGELLRVVADVTQ